MSDTPFSVCEFPLKSGTTFVSEETGISDSLQPLKFTVCGLGVVEFDCEFFQPGAGHHDPSVPISSHSVVIPLSKMNYGAYSCLNELIVTVPNSAATFKFSVTSCSNFHIPLFKVTASSSRSIFSEVGSVVPLQLGPGTFKSAVLTPSELGEGVSVRFYDSSSSPSYSDVPLLSCRVPNESSLSVTPNCSFVHGLFAVVEKDFANVNYNTVDISLFV